MSIPILTLLSADFARTFLGSADPVSVGIVAQIGTVNGIAEVASALVMAVLAVRFNHKSLLLLGVVLEAIAAVGTFFAPTLGWMLVFFGVEGAATVMVGIMIFTLIGDTFSLEEKPKVVSYIPSATALAIIAGLPLMGLISNLLGWRFVFTLMVLPLSVAGLLLAFIYLPHEKIEQALLPRKKMYTDSFRHVLFSKSAAACLIGGMLGGAGAVGVFSIAFLRGQYLVTRDFATGMVMLVAIFGIIANLTVGRLVKRMGAKKLAVGSALAAGVFVILIFVMPNLWSFVVLDIAHVVFAAGAATAVAILAIDQAPKSRGTMMSLRSVFLNLGGALGTGIGGALLFKFASYQVLGIALGITGFAAATVIFFLTTDTSRTPPQPQ
jgi:predicted MFS family arabinose efflux permease